MNTGQAQDYIFKKNNTIQKGKILEVNIDKIKYKKLEVSNGPVYEILKSDVVKIQYGNGYIDIINPITISDSLFSETQKKKIDTINYSMIYFLFNSGQDESQKFPIYLNNNYLVTLKNHMRATYKMFSEGIVILERIGVHAYKKGPKIGFTVEHGNYYGIRISEPYSQALDPNKRFTLEVISDSTDLQEFLKNEFYGFKSFKGCDIKLEERLKKPITK